MSPPLTGTRPDTSLRDQSLPSGTLRVLQLTDTHVYADPGGTLLGVNTYDSLQQVIAHFQTHYWEIDLLLVTGDLVHDATPTGYAKMREILSGFGVPVYCLPGNHDVPAVMHDHLAGGPVSTDVVCDLGDWRFVMLDSVIPNDEGGRLEPGQIDALREALADKERHTLVCMHHQPVKVGSAWIDTMAIENPEPLFAVIDEAPQVRGLLWGHIHQTYEGERNGIRLMASPSTCVQFAPAIDEFKVDEEPPGFRLLALLPDGSIRSEVIRIDALPQGLEVASSGY
jgi:Icc protein